MAESPIIIPAYASDELAVGIGLAFAIHAIPAVMVGLTLAGYVHLRTTEHKAIAPPIIAAELLKLGDEARVFELPQRRAPAMATKPDDTVVASENASNEPVEKRDAGVKPKNAKEEDLLARFAEKAEAFAEKNAAPAVAVVDAGAPGGMGVAGSPNGSTFGTQTDPSKVRGGSVYAAQLREFFKSQWSIPSFLDPRDVASLSVKYKVSFDQQMHVVAVSEQPVQSSGNDFFDDSARNMLLRLRDQRANLPQPPEDEAPTFRGKTIVLKFSP
jgi:hypothetical protein